MDIQENDVKSMVMTAEETHVKMEVNALMEKIHSHVNVPEDLLGQHAKRKLTNASPTLA